MKDDDQRDPRIDAAASSTSEPNASSNDMALIVLGSGLGECPVRRSSLRDRYSTPV